jgi:hypothetical protein
MIFYYGGTEALYAAITEIADNEEIVNVGSNHTKIDEESKLISAINDNF